MFFRQPAFHARRDATLRIDENRIGNRAKHAVAVLNRVVVVEADRKEIEALVFEGVSDGCRPNGDLNADESGAFVLRQLFQLLPEEQKRFVTMLTGVEEEDEDHCLAPVSGQFEALIAVHDVERE